jgi:hypothetical protein
LVAFLLRQLCEQFDALLPGPVRRALTRQPDDFFASAKRAIEEHFGRFHPKLRARRGGLPTLFRPRSPGKWSGSPRITENRRSIISRPSWLMRRI